jgi:hypothetical protein
MPIKIICDQIKFQLKQWGAIAAFYILLILVLINFSGNVFSYYGQEILEMIHPMKLLSLSYNLVYQKAGALLMLIQLYPILVCIPAGLSLAREQKFGLDTLIVARIGSSRYHLYKLISTFFTTFIVFSVPFLIEILLNCLAFPLNAQGDLSNFDIYNPRYISMVKNYMFSKLYLFSPYVYAAIGTLLWGVFSGILSSLTIAISSIVKFKYRISLLLPVFLLLNASVYLSHILEAAGFEIEWYHYVLIFDDSVKNYIYWGVIMVIITILSVSGTILGGKKDCIQ